MEKFMKISKSASKAPANKDKPNLRYNPYEAGANYKQHRLQWIEESRKKPTMSGNEPGDVSPGNQTTESARIRKYIVNTLSHPGNPITHSDAPQRADYVSSCATGHERSEDRVKRPGYFAARNAKIEAQREPATNTIFRGCRIYCNSGYCAGTTDLELKRLVSENGGTVSPTANGATHILTSMGLSGSKTQNFLTKNQRVKCHVVKPEWIFDSIQAGKRKQEWGYTIVKSTSQKGVHELMKPIAR